jgi:hypothetical protein
VGLGQVQENCICLAVVLFREAAELDVAVRDSDQVTDAVRFKLCTSERERQAEEADG